MAKDSYEHAARTRVKTIVDALSQGDAHRLAAVTRLERSWYQDGAAHEESVRMFLTWLGEQLALWAEEYGRAFVVDPYAEERLDLDSEFVNGRTFSTYQPTSHGEELDFWFEILLYYDECEQLISELNVNF